MAKIIPCSFGSDTASASNFGCNSTGGLVAFYLAKGSDLDLAAMAEVANYNDFTEELKLPPVLIGSATLKKLDFDSGTIRLTSTGDRTKMEFTDRIEFNVKGLSIAKMHNYRRFLGCCGYVVFGVLTDGTVVAIGLQPTITGVAGLTLSKEALRTVKLDYDSGIGDDDNPEQIFTMAAEGVSTHGIMVFSVGVSASQLEGMT